MPIVTQESVRKIAGVNGRAFAVVVDDESGRILNQKWGASRTRGTENLTVEMRFDDECRNGHETFSITATLRDSRFRRDGGFVSGGCLHDDIADWFPELKPLIRWHLVSTDGPMHYVTNTVYLAGDRDCWGLRAGESEQIRNGKSKRLPLMRVGEGKPRDLDAARSCAVWPEATDEELCADPGTLRAVLIARLPALLAELKYDMTEFAGFKWPAK